MNLEKIENAFEFVRNGASIKQEAGLGGIPITRIETIWNEEIDINRFGYADIADTNIGLYKKHLLKNGDLLMTHINSPKHLGKCALYEDEPKILIHGMNLLCLRPNANVSDPKFLKYYFKTKSFKGALSKISNQSVNQASFSAGKLKQVDIPLPPLEEQKQIAAILDASDELRQKDKALIAKYDELTQSLFLDMFGDPVSNSKGWDENTMGEVLDLITYGLTVRPEYIKNGVPLISAREIRSGEVNYDSAPNISESDFENLSEKGKPKLGDILFSKTGSIGHCAIVNNSKVFAVTQNAARLSFKDHVNEIYALYYLRSPYIQLLARKRAKGNAVKDLQLGDMKKFVFLNPPYTLQSQFAKYVQTIDSQKVLAEESLNKSEDLFNSLLQKAFKGELTN
jgi:type I restriction enzyme, S subunit